MSALEQHLTDYLQLRHSLGHELAEAGRLLPGLVAYLDSCAPSTRQTSASRSSDALIAVKPRRHRA